MTDQFTPETERPPEPYSSSDRPEQWALIASWESDRADKLERERNAARADAARLLSELADERAKKSDALIAAVDDIERLTAERDDAAALAKNYAERMARSDAELAAARAALAQ